MLPVLANPRISLKDETDTHIPAFPTTDNTRRAQQDQAMNRPDIWSRSARFFHWLIAVLILVQAGVGLTMVRLPLSPDVIPVYDFHKSLGLTILLLAVLRLGWRLAQRRPAEIPMPGWQTVTSRITHVALYVLLFAMPISGWLFDSATGLRPLYWWGWLKMPHLVAANETLAEYFEWTHISLFWVLVAVTALHLAAALKHHFIDRDATLRRMLPWAGRKLQDD